MGGKTLMILSVRYQWYGASQVALVAKNPPAKAEDTRDKGLIPGSGRASGGGHGDPLQCSYVENPMERSLEDYSP